MNLELSAPFGYHLASIYLAFVEAYDLKLGVLPRLEVANLICSLLLRL